MYSKLVLKYNEMNENKQCYLFCFENNILVFLYSLDVCAVITMFQFSAS